MLLVFPGGEEVGNQACVRGCAAIAVDLIRTILLSSIFDSLGSGGHLVVARREGLTGRLDAEDIKLATDVASAAGIELRTVCLPNVWNTSMARQKRMHAISLLSYESGWVRNLHMRNDTVDRVRWNTVHQAVTLVEKLALTWSNGGRGNG